MSEDDHVPEVEPQAVEGPHMLSLDCNVRTENGYKSGEPYPIEVIQIDGKDVELRTAAAFIAMHEAALEQNVDIRIISGFRTMAQQQYLYDCYINQNCNGGNLAATPGYSRHQSGTALDLNRKAAGVYAFLASRGAEFGFFETVPGEPWHWDWNPNAVDESSIPAICQDEDTDVDVPPQDTCTDPCFPEHSLGASCRDDDVSACVLDEEGCTGWVLVEACGDDAACQGDGAAATCCTGTFCDDDGHWAESEIDQAAADGITEGCGTHDGQLNFCPDRESDRCEAITMVGRASEMPLGGGDAFSDDDGLFCEPFINAAAHHGVTNGTAPGEFSPDMLAPRSQIAALIARAWALPAPSGDHFGDDEDLPAWARDAHNQLFEAGIAMGCPGTTNGKPNFCGDDIVTRAELAVFLTRSRDVLGVPNW